MKKLEGKVAVVTGGNSGIGLAVAQEFSRQGAKVAVFGRNRETLSEAEKSIRGEVLAVQGDVQRLEDIDKLFTQIKERFGKIDSLVVNAGVIHFGPITEVDEKAFDFQTNVNFKGAFFTIQKALPLLQDGGTIILVSSVAGIKGFAGASVYSATKAALRSLARTLTAELAPRRIRVNVLSPGPIDTPIFDRPDNGIPESEIENMKNQFGSMVPFGRMGSSDEMANVALFLASDDSSYVTGVDLAADGGMAQV